jgi:hypothetical protein
MIMLRATYGDGEESDWHWHETSPLISHLPRYAGSGVAQPREGAGSLARDGRRRPAMALSRIEHPAMGLGMLHSRTSI